MTHSLTFLTSPKRQGKAIIAFTLCNIASGQIIYNISQGLSLVSYLLLTIAATGYVLGYRQFRKVDLDKVTFTH